MGMYGSEGKNMGEYGAFFFCRTSLNMN